MAPITMKCNTYQFHPPLLIIDFDISFVLSGKPLCSCFLLYFAFSPVLVCASKSDQTSVIKHTDWSRFLAQTLDGVSETAKFVIWRKREEKTSSLLFISF